MTAKSNDVIFYHLDKNLIKFGQTLKELYDLEHFLSDTLVPWKKLINFCNSLLSLHKRVFLFLYYCALTLHTFRAMSEIALHTSPSRHIWCESNKEMRTVIWHCGKQYRYLQNGRFLKIILYTNFMESHRFPLFCKNMKFSLSSQNILPSMVYKVYR